MQGATYRPTSHPSSADLARRLRARAADLESQARRERRAAARERRPGSMLQPIRRRPTILGGPIPDPLALEAGARALRERAVRLQAAPTFPSSPRPDSSRQAGDTSAVTEPDGPEPPSRRLRLIPGGRRPCPGLTPRERAKRAFLASILSDVRRRWYA